MDLDLRGGEGEGELECGKSWCEELLGGVGGDN